MFVASGAADASRMNLVSKQQGLQGRLMWLDADANLWKLSSRAGVAETVAKCKAANINTIIVDVKPLSGLVLYNSGTAPKMGRFEGKAYPRGYDLLRTLIEEGHKAGIKVHAAINVFSEGSQKLRGGPAFKHRDWQCVQYEMERTLSADDGTNIKLACSATSCEGNGVFLYGEDPDSTGKLEPNTFYVRVTQDGRPQLHGTASGRARLSAPSGGYVLAGTGAAGEWLRGVVERGGRFELKGTKILLPVTATDTAHNAVFVNPLHPQARAYALSIIREISDNYRIDGLVLDRMRYPNIYADFSDLTRAAFERHIGRKVERWPEDIYERDAVPSKEVKRGPLFKDWLRFRAQVMRDFLAEARGVVKSARPGALLGIYVGSWYPLYYDVGVNWGSPTHRRSFEWWPDGYENTGYADLVDYMCTGCYYAHPTRREAAARGDQDWKSVEAAAEESVSAVGDETFVYGSLYLRQYNNRPEKFIEALQQCLSKTQGVMFFDLVYVRDYDWWEILRKSFPTPKKAPHDVPGLRERIRELAKQGADGLR